MDVQDIPASFEEMEEWLQVCLIFLSDILTELNSLQEFADQHVAYEETNTVIAGTALSELLYPIPKMLKGVFASVALSLLDDQYRDAYGSVLHLRCIRPSNISLGSPLRRRF